MFAYEYLEVYNKASAVNEEVYYFLMKNKTLPYYVKDQLARASFSIMLNISEGTANFGGRNRRRYYIIARGSVFECSSIIGFLFKVKEISEEFRNLLMNFYEDISKMLFGLIKQLEKENKKS